MALNPNEIKSKQPGVYGDGGGLYLVVREKAGGDVDRLWAIKFTDKDGKRAQMDLARVGDKEGEMSLKKARIEAAQYQFNLKRHGIDPRHKKKLEEKGGKTFKEYWDEKAPGWCAGKSEDEPKAWARSLRDIKTLHDLKLHEIENTHVIEALKPIWWEKPISANRTRERIEKLLVPE